MSFGARQFTLITPKACQQDRVVSLEERTDFLGSMKKLLRRQMSELDAEKCRTVTNFSMLM
jgi:hypothetical protein